jgi:hypothetical protein
VKKKSSIYHSVASIITSIINKRKIKKKKRRIEEKLNKFLKPSERM